MRGHRTVAAAFVISVVMLVLSGCTSADPAPERGQPSAEVTAPISLSPEVAHLHGLQVSADRTLLAGTHHGLVAIDPAGATTVVGTSDDDLMGLTGIPGSDMVFASGHPGRSSSAPNPLGLLASTDGGSSWEDRSLSGEVDFHVLAAADGLLIGSGGGPTLQVSHDAGETWTPGAELVPRTLAITADGIWAATEEGAVWHSTDDARSFAEISAPTIGLLAGSGSTLWAVDVDGYAWQQLEGRAWLQHSWIGAPDAITVAPDGTAYAATNAELWTLTPRP
ncbi:hypothetical protein DFR67_13019 [Williamsia limnetica]|uniref:BNR/Asp-box repeat protein n=1 Tax=Williamsia limnetica TaxID=882452 RepID=A0A318RD76_WILLI|nr:exo-alpha-sialidase [Williamsia limnetica]PYE11811.1 hypothetical protein DFR67_13019 [Williamsia limnetica]